MVQAPGKLDARSRARAWKSYLRKTGAGWVKREGAGPVGMQSVFWHGV